MWGWHKVGIFHHHSDPQSSQLLHIVVITSSLLFTFSGKQSNKPNIIFHLCPADVLMITTMSLLSLTCRLDFELAASCVVHLINATALSILTGFSKTLS